jgi:TATA-box binding protein (TBP) (component of TFIID and TFIIIB)
MIDEDIVPAEKLEKVQMDLQSLPETWDGLVTKADEKKKTYVMIYEIGKYFEVFCCSNTRSIIVNLGNPGFFLC